MPGKPNIPLPAHPRLRFLSKDEAAAQGFLPFFGFLLPFEYWMLDSVIADLERAGRAFVGTRDHAGHRGVMIEARPLENLEAADLQDSVTSPQ